MMVMTTRGEMDDSLLERKTGVVESEKEHTEWVEYWFEGEMVHRSVNMQLKEGAISQTLAGVFS